MAKITRQSILTGVTRTLVIPGYDQDDFMNRYIQYKHGYADLDDLFPNMSNTAKNFIMYGTTEEEWQEYHKDDNLERDNISLFFK